MSPERRFWTIVLLVVAMVFVLGAAVVTLLPFPLNPWGTNTFVP